ncbi:MAG: DMT family transporter [candidate division Zixibacteria bacterium]|nr:DMT family transporter [candidate division Zixibacteria bacterium]MBU1469688.1 DMT family transporter [candidate division Zixibacteria bacterium]MBU2626819.1 DMT family transporter [candidate division Zixibacteria bacterium]
MNDQTDNTTERSAGSGYAFAVGSTFASGLATVVGKWNLAHISPLLMNSLIFLIATIFLSVTLLPARGGIKNVFRLSAKGWFWIAMFVISSLLAVWGYWAGVQRMDPTLATFLNRAEVMVAIILGMIFLRERFTKVETLGVLLSIAGIIVMRLTLRVEYTSGFWFVLGGAFFFGITEFVSKIAVRYVEPLILGYIRNMMLALLYWIAFGAVGRGFDGLSSVWPGVLALALIGPVAARLMYLTALNKLELSRVAVISQSQPVFVILIALLALGQLPTFREITGGVLLTLGCVIMILSRYTNNRRLRHS